MKKFTELPIRRKENITLGFIILKLKHIAKKRLFSSSARISYFFKILIKPKIIIEA